MKLTKHFDESEFLCPCCGQHGPIRELFALAEALEEWRTLLSVGTISGIPIKITSGFRCIDQNMMVGGVAMSYHTLGMAADCVPQGVSLYEAVMEAERVKEFTGIGLYISPDGKGWIHVDIRQDSSGKWGEFILGKKHKQIGYVKAREIAREISQERGSIMEPKQ